MTLRRAAPRTRRRGGWCWPGTGATGSAFQFDREHSCIPEVVRRVYTILSAGKDLWGAAASERDCVTSSPTEKPKTVFRPFRQHPWLCRRPDSQSLRSQRARWSFGGGQAFGRPL